MRIRIKVRVNVRVKVKIRARVRLRFVFYWSDFLAFIISSNINEQILDLSPNTAMPLTPYPH